MYLQSVIFIWKRKGLKKKHRNAAFNFMMSRVLSIAFGRIFKAKKMSPERKYAIRSPYLLLPDSES